MNSRNREVGRVVGGTLPPYAHYGTFKRVIRELGKSLGRPVPRKIDGSLIPSVSGAIQSQIVVALRYLRLVDGGDQSTDRLMKMAKGEDSEYREVLRGALIASYSGLF